jgi:outer membrane protein assembly factor BamB
VGDRVFVLTDGCRLSCLDRRDGTLRWSREGHLRSQVPEEVALLPVEEHVRRWHRLRPVEARRREHEAQIQRRRREGQEVGSLEQELAAARATEAPLAAAFAEVASAGATESRSGQPNRYHTQSAVTYAIATPCSDGQRIYAWLPMGVMVAYDLDGTLVWLRVLGERRCGGGWWGGQVAPSPLLVDGRLVVHYDRIYGLDAATGTTLWTQDQRLLPIPSPVAARVDGTWYVALGTVQILRLADGTYVHGDATGGHHDTVGVGSPIALPGGFTWTSHAVAPADRLLWELDGETAGRLTQFNHIRRPHDGERFHLRGMGWHGYGSPLLDRGQIHYHHENGILSRIDATTGAWIASIPSNLPATAGRPIMAGGAVYPSLTLAGSHLFATGDAGTLVLELAADGTPRPIGFNRVGGLGGNMLVFAGRDLLLHVGTLLACWRR